MGYFATAEELSDELYASLTDFFASEIGAQARKLTLEGADSATLVLHTVDPEATFSVDFHAGTVVRQAVADGDVEIELEADALHDILLERLDPVNISRLYETDRIAFRGESRNLAALIALAGKLQPFYPASLARRGRQELLKTPLPETKQAWLAEGPYREVIGHRRPWQRAKRSSAG